MDTNSLKATKAMLDYIERSPNSFFAVENASRMLEEQGFSRLDEREPYKLELGGKYYVVRNSSALMAFILPKEHCRSFSIIASHSDSPSFKVKENPEIGGLYTTLNVEGYGGMLMAPWLDRPLSIAGRAFIRTSEGVQQRLVNIDRDLCSIVNLCIHQNREANSGLEYKIQKDMLPIIGQGVEQGCLKGLVAKTLNVEESSIVDTELFLYNRQKPSIWGIDDQFYSSPRIDDLQCLYCSLVSLMKASGFRSIPVACVFDNEEVGSGTKQGAAGDFMSQNLNRILSCLGYDDEEKAMVQARSFMLSADNGHSMHPNYPEHCDPTNKPSMNAGVLIKYAGNQKYTTDGYSASRLRALLEDRSIKYQVFHNNSNNAGGSTLGNISGSQYSIPCVDIGLAQLAMHSSYETGGTADTLIMTEAMKAFYEA
ncbi:MAG: M18 family aminopeptidase [Sphaerochaetaceae bacterium]|jgi:aspartyl aminopeptidase|nr:M18 family aminopeptidase [Sphaerochaetaceae bacterium]